MTDNKNKRSLFVVHWDDTTEDEPGFGSTLGLFSTEARAVAFINEDFAGKFDGNTGKYSVFTYHLNDPKSEKLMRVFSVDYYSSGEGFELVDISPIHREISNPPVVDSFVLTRTVGKGIEERYISLALRVPWAQVRYHDTATIHFDAGTAIPRRRRTPIVLDTAVTFTCVDIVSGESYDPTTRQYSPVAWVSTTDPDVLRLA